MNRDSRKSELNQLCAWDGRWVPGKHSESQVHPQQEKNTESNATDFCYIFRTAAVIGAHCCKTCKRYFEVRIKSRRHNEPEEAPQHFSCQHSRPQKNQLKSRTSARIQL